MILRIKLARRCASAESGRRTDSFLYRDRAGRAAFRFDHNRNDLLQRAHCSLSHVRGFCAGPAEQFAASGSMTACIQRTIRASINPASNLGAERSQHVVNNLAGGCGLGLMRARSWDHALAAAPPAGKTFGGVT